MLKIFRQNFVLSKRYGHKTYKFGHKYERSTILTIVQTLQFYWVWKKFIFKKTQFDFSVVVNLYKTMSDITYSTKSMYTSKIY